VFSIRTAAAPQWHRTWALAAIKFYTPYLLASAEPARLVDGGPSHTLFYKGVRIEQVLWPEMLSGPLATFSEFDAHEIAGVAIEAIAHNAHQLAVAIANHD
jgi:hypothetical protein